MSSFVALLRAVNVGGTGKLPMAALKDICEDLGFAAACTYIASGCAAHCDANAANALSFRSSPVVVSTTNVGLT